MTSMVAAEPIELLDGSTVVPQEVPARIRVNLLEQRFGRIMVIGYAGRVPYGTAGHTATTWIGQCDCGKRSLFMGTNLRSGKTRQCLQCSKRAFSRSSYKHGLSGTYLYFAWRHIRGRCCRRWRNSVQAFADDIRPRPTLKHVLVHPVTGICKPGNCYWGTREDQNNNPGRGRRGRMFTHDGRTMCIADWAAEIGITRERLRQRLLKYSPEVALTTPRGEAPNPNQTDRPDG